MAYTYLIGWPEHRKYYYGVRYAKNADPSDLWVSYFTSSKHVKRFVEENGNTSVIQVRKIFSEANEAIAWESKVLARMDVINDKKWLNKTNNKSIAPETAYPIWSKESRKKRSESQKGVTLSAETRRKISLAHKGRKKPWLTGKKRPEHSEKLSGASGPAALSFEYKGKHYGTIREFQDDLGISYYIAKKIINTENIPVRRKHENGVRDQ